VKNNIEIFKFACYGTTPPDAYFLSPDFLLDNLLFLLYSLSAEGHPDFVTIPYNRMVLKRELERPLAPSSR
jgi:hypothetical protein